MKLHPSALAGACALAIFACAPAETPQVQAISLETPAPASAAGPHEATAQLQNAVIWREVPVTVRSLDHIQVAAESNGRVLRVFAEAGDEVEVGQLLAELDAEVFQSRHSSALAAIELAQSEYDRVYKLFQEKVASTREWDGAQSRLKQAQAQFDLAETALAKSKVLAPVAGVVEARLAGPGDLAFPGKPLFSLYDPSRLVLEAQLPVQDRDFASLGQALDWQVESTAGRAAITEVAPSSDPRSRTLRVRLALDSKAHYQPGSFGTLRYAVGNHACVCVPADSVFQVGQVEMVRVKKGARWVRRAVRTGRRREDKIEILSGLKGGEVVGRE
ncbi:MAG: efflux RND transporter periplasmic adaptor subunit [Planctomycetes bacterium]|nr:efflux RND transporter periplasmic adaptor subunit [Planctomycetota bacterium]MBT5119383.1 efflux RND transporter periplasmic adaptor subunit [Planctomycetota bacterium]